MKSLKQFIYSLKSLGQTRRAVATIFRAMTSTLRPASMLLLCPALSGLAAAAVLEGSQPKDWPADPAKHEVTVRREAGDEKLAAMIAAAEAAQPSKEVLRKAAGDAAVPEGERVWWYKEELGIRIPCAITADAVAYYSELVGKYGKQQFKRFVAPSSQLEYHATVAFHKEFKHEGKAYNDVHVVTLKLTFSQNFAATETEGMNFEKQRVVILDADGKVLHISGDGPTEVPILAI